MKFLANLFGGGQEGVVRYALARQKAVRRHRRAETVGDIDRGRHRPGNGGSDAS